MKRIANRLISALLLLSLALAFVSCEPSPEKLLEKAENKLQNTTYTIEVNYDYSCSDKIIEQALKSVEDMDMSIQVDGQNFKVDMEMTMSMMGYAVSTNVDYIAIDGILYAYAKASVLGQTETTKQKATIPPEELEGLTGEMTGTGDISFSDFQTLEMVETEDGYKITCSGISEEARAALAEETEDQMTVLGNNVGVTLGDITFCYEIEDGRIDNMVVSMTYTMTLNGTSYEMGMSIEIDYDYDQPVSISAPTDADKYTEVEYSFIMG